MLLLGDCNDQLKDIKDNSIDLLLTDPPYGLVSEEYREGKNHKGGFMGKDWDRALVSTETWKECYRVLKQGKLAFVMCSPRQDVLSRMIINLQDAGFRTNYTSLYHTFASGFPKAKNNHDGSYVGAQFKPAVEIILVVSKGKTLTWLDDCRIPYQSEDDREYIAAGIKRRAKGDYIPFDPANGWNNHHMQTLETNPEKGRFPANLICEDDILNDGHNYKVGDIDQIKEPRQFCTSDKYSRYTKQGDSGSYSRYFSLDSWWNKTFPFLIVPKASKGERNKGVETLEPIKVNDGRNTPIDNPFQRGETLRTNSHPTVKPLKLMSYLITMGSREGDLVLDPFCGSGTVCIAADQLHRKWLGIERNPEYAEIIKRRLMVPLSQLKLTVYD